MTLYSAAMTTELARQGREVLPVVEVVLPSGTLRVAGVAWSSDARGHYEPWLADPGTIPRNAVSIGSLEKPQWAFTVIDPDHTFEDALAGYGRIAVRRSAVTCWLAGRTLAFADWATLFTGILVDWEQADAHRWTLKCERNDSPLRRDTIGTVTRQDWPQAHTDAIGKVVPRIYGKHSSASVTLKGLVPTLYVDTVGFRYLVCARRVKAIDAVYKGGVAVTSGWATVVVTINGRDYTLVDFTTDQVAGVITVDVRGYETVGDGGGTLIENPATMLQHYLANWVYGEHKTGNWLASATAPMDAALLATAQTFFTNRDYAAARYLDSVTHALEALSQWAHDYRARTFWTRAGEIGIKVDDPSEAMWPATWRRWNEQTTQPRLGGFGAPLLRSALGRYCWDASTDKFLFELVATDPAADTDEASETMDLPWGAAQL